MEWREYVSLQKKGGFHSAELNHIRHPLGVRAADPDNLWMHFTRTRETLYEAFMKRLKEGSIIANGYDSRLPANARPINIPPEIWAHLMPDFDDSSASGHMMSFAAILVTAGGAAQVRRRRETEAWMRIQRESAWPPHSRAALERQGLDELGDDFHGVIFGELWKEYADEDMKKAGRKSPKRITKRSRS